MSESEYSLGTLTGDLAFDLPASELSKLDMLKDVTKDIRAQLDGIAELRSVEVVKDLGDTTAKFKFDMPKKEQSKLDFFLKQVPILKDFYKAFASGGAAGIGTAAAVLGAVGVLFMSGSGFRSVLGALWDLLGMVSDLVFVALFPVIRPLLDAFVDFARFLAEKSRGKGGIFGALMDPELWAGAVGIFVDGLLQSWTAFMQLGAAIIDGFLTGLDSEDARLKAIWTSAGESFIEALTATGYFASKMVDLFVTVFTNPKVTDAFVQIGLTIAESFLEGLARRAVGSLVSKDDEGRPRIYGNPLMPLGGLGGLSVGGFV